MDYLYYIALMISAVVVYIVAKYMIKMLNNHIQDDLFKDIYLDSITSEDRSWPTATVWPYLYNRKKYYRWLADDESNEGFDMFTSREEATKNAIENGYLVD